MEAIILAGGLGTRLREAVPDLPKPMAPINGKPFLEYLIKNLKSKEFSRIILAVGYMANKIEDYFGSNYDGVEILYSKELEPLGTGGAIRLAMEKCKEDHVYVFNGDTYLDLEVIEVENLWMKKKRPIIVGRFMDDTGRYGRIESDNNRIISFREKRGGSSGVINAGCYVLKLNELDKFPVQKKFSIEENFFEKNTFEKNLLLFCTNGYFMDIGIPEAYRAFQEYIK